MERLSIHRDIVIMMTSLKAALCLACLCLWNSAMTTVHKGSVHQETSFIAANVGDTVTLQCFFEDEISTLFYWYKQFLGQEPRLISTFYKQNKNGTFSPEFEKEGRFTLKTGHSKHHLTIKNLLISDSATYYCSGGYVNTFIFGSGTFLSVKNSGTNIPASIYQSSSQIIHSGDPLTLSCTVHTGNCGGEHSVYWFRDSGESHPGLIYTQGGSSDQCVARPNTQTHTCVYNLTMKSLNLSQTGSYYCAVASCGHILFGNGTRVDIEHEVELSNLTLVRVLSGALVLTTILVVLLALLVFKAHKTKRCRCKESQMVSAPDTTPEADQQEEDDLHYAALKTQKVNRSRRQRGNSENDCVYASVRQ